MDRLKKLGLFISVVVLLICVYSFLLGNEVFNGKFTNNYFAWYMLAKGIYCSAVLYVLILILSKEK